MKEFKKNVFLVGCVLGGMSFHSYGLGSFQSITSESIGTEASTTGTLTANIAGDSIVLTAGAAYSTGAGARLVVSLIGGATFADSGYSLEQSSGGAGTGDLTHWTLAGGSPVGQSSIEFILGTSTVAIGDDFILSGSSIAGQSVNFNVPSASSGAEIDMDAQYKDSPTTIVEEFTQIELFQYANEFSGALDTSADGVIDVDDSRLSFEGGVSSDVIALEFTEAAITNGVSLNDDDKVNITLSGDMSNIASIAVGTGTSGSASRGNMTIDTAANTATISLSASDAFVASSSTVLTVNVSGSSALATRSFTVQADLDFAAETDKNMIAAATSAGSWSINGLQAKVSHLSLNSTGFISWLKVINESTAAAEISADIIWTLADGTEGSVTAAVLGTVDAGGIATVSEASILAAMGSPTQLADVSMTVTVAGPVNSVHLVAEKKASDGRLPIPVYYNTLGATPRVWMQ